MTAPGVNSELLYSLSEVYKLIYRLKAELVDVRE